MKSRFLRISNAVMKHHDKSNLGRNTFTKSYSSIPLFIIKGHKLKQGKKLSADAMKEGAPHTQWVVSFTSIAN